MTSEVDHLIVGAGAAGCALAARLSEDPDRQVLLVEAGPDLGSGAGRPRVLRDSRLMPIGEYDWSLRADAGGGRMVGFPVGRAVGGTSLIGGAGAWRPRASDFDAWAAGGLPEWSWARLAPLFEAVESDAQFGARPGHGADGPLPITRFCTDQLLGSMRAFTTAVQDAGHPFCEDLNSPDATGVGPNPLAVSGHDLVSPADVYLTDEVRARPNLTVRAELPVTRLCLDHARVTGVVAGEETISAQETILCAGVPLSPALLLRSGIGPPDVLTGAGVNPVIDLPGVGASLMDQPAVMLLCVPAGAAGPEPEPFLQVAARLERFPCEPADHAMYLCLFHRMPVEDGLKPLLRSEVAHWLIVSDLAPASRGVITLGEDLGPRCDLRFYEQPRDFDRMRAGVLALWELTKHPALAEQIERVGLVTEKMLHNEVRLRSIIHGRTVSRQPWGGCRMAPSGDDQAVVDADGRVYGVERLRVADTSIVPVALRAGGVLTGLVIGERIAAAIRGEQPLHAAAAKVGAGR